jgi:hypothetical protein
MTDLVVRLRESMAGLPPPFLAVLVLAVGWVAAFALRFIVSRILAAIRFDRMGEKTGLAEFLRKGNARYTPSRLMGVLVYWITLLAALLEVLRIVDEGIYKAFSDKLVQSLPNLAAGVLIIIVGSLVVSFIANFTLTIALNASMPNARLLSKTIKYLGIVVMVMVALGQVGLGKSIVDFLFEVLFGAAAFGASLAFGLGCKDIAHDSMQRFLRNLREKGRSGQDSDLEG